MRPSLYLNQRPESSAVRMLLPVVMATPAAELMRLGTPDSDSGGEFILVLVGFVTICNKSTIIITL